MRGAVISAANFLNDVSCLTNKLCDLLEIACLNEVFLNHPATAASKDSVICKILTNVLCADSACRHELNACVRSCHSFDEAKAAGRLCREELHCIKTKCESLLYFARCAGTRAYRNSSLNAVFNNFRIETRADDELCTCVNCTVDLLYCED